METRRIKARNGEGLTFSVVGEGMGPLGDFYELLDEKTSSRDDRASARQRRKSVRTLRLAPATDWRKPGWAQGLARQARRDPRVRQEEDRPHRRPERQAADRTDVVSPGFAGGHPHAPRFDYSYDGAMRSLEHSLLRTGLEPARHRSHP